MNEISNSSEWEKEKFSREAELKEHELQLLHEKVIAQNRLVNVIAILVPVLAALVTAIPAYINSQNQQELKRLEIEGQLIMNSTKTGDPDQAAVNLKFLVDSGLLSGTTAQRVSRYLEIRIPGSGRALPEN